MEIKIQRSSNIILFDQSRALWKTVKDNRPLISYVFPILSLVLGIISILLCIASFRLGERFWKPESTFGIILILLSLSSYLIRYNQKKVFFDRTKKNIEEYQENKNVTEIILTESLIKIRDFQSYHEMEWSCFKNIKKEKDHFFFMYDKTYQNGFIISKVELTENQFQELTNFIQSLNKLQKLL